MLEELGKDINLSAFQTQSEKLKVFQGRGLTGRVWHSKSYEWVKNV